MQFFVVFEKCGRTYMYLFQIALEIILLPIFISRVSNTVHFELNE